MLLKLLPRQLVQLLLLRKLGELLLQRQLLELMLLLQLLDCFEAASGADVAVSNGRSTVSEETCVELVC
jgi:hypothetical protein